MKPLWDKYMYVHVVEVMEEIISLGQRQRDVDFHQKMLEVSGQRGARSHLRRPAPQAEGR